VRGTSIIGMIFLSLRYFSAAIFGSANAGPSLSILHANTATLLFSYVRIDGTTRWHHELLCCDLRLCSCSRALRLGEWRVSRRVSTGKKPCCWV
jgi:hypothetical protein